MVSKPSFDPNEFILGFTDEAWARLNDATLRPLTNRTIDGLYPPGSIFKVVTMAAGMEKLGMPPGEGFSCAGSFKLPKAPQVWGDWKPGGHGRVNLVQGLTTSCDIVFYTIGQRLDALKDDGSPLAEMSRAFGLGKPTGLVDLPDVGGNVPDHEWKTKTFSDVWATGDTINFAIGQGFLLVTPLQMAAIYVAIANGGSLMAPYLTQRVTLPGGPDIAQLSRSSGRNCPCRRGHWRPSREGSMPSQLRWAAPATWPSRITKALRPLGKRARPRPGQKASRTPGSLAIARRWIPSSSSSRWSRKGAMPKAKARGSRRPSRAPSSSSRWPVSSRLHRRRPRNPRQSNRPQLWQHRR